MEPPCWSRERRSAAWIAFAVLLSALAFLPHAAGEFVWDDVYLVRDNPWLYRWGGLRAVLGMDLWGQATGHPAQLFHPLPVMTLWLQGCLHGPSVVGFRLGNWGLHLLTVFLFHRVLRRGRFRPPTALLAAMVVLLHPSVTEPVMWITGRHDTVGVACLLLALLAWPGPGGPWPRALLAGACAGLAFLSKEQFLVAPFLLVAFACLEARANGAGIPWRWLPLAFAGLLGALLWRARLGIPFGSDQLGRGWGALLRSYAAIVQHYGGQLLGLRNGATFAPFAPSGALATGATLVGLSALVGLAGRSAWRDPARFAMPWLGLFWFALALGPYVAAVPAIGTFGNRYAYLPLFGLGLALAGLTRALADRLPPPNRAIRGLAWVVLPLALSLATSRAAADWASNRTLYQADVDRQPTNGFAHYYLGYAILRQEGCAAALVHFQAATFYAPAFERGWHNLAGCLVNLGRPAQAIDPARRALALDPAKAANHYNLAAALWNTRHPAEARAELEAALRLDPGHAPSRQLLEAAKASATE